jgi:3D (Asp-Asp-Asp) domain-containing protein
MRIIFLMIVASAFCFFCGSCSFSEFSLSNQFGKIEALGPAYTVRTTAYSHREKEQGGKYGALTASGRRLRYGRIRSAGADWSRYPLDTKFRIVGQPHIYVVEDYGRSLVGTNTIDLYKPTLRGIRNWGTRRVNIQIIEWGSLQRSAEILKGRLHYAHVRKMYNTINAKRN